MWRWLSVVALVTFFADDVWAQESPEANALVGCYALDLGEWEPALMEGNRANQTPPDTLLLSDQVGDGAGSPFERGRKLVRPVIDRGRTPTAFWIEDGSGTVQIVWTNGHSGVRLNVTATENDGLTGVAEAFTDVLGRPLPRSEVTLRRVQCTGAQGGRE